MKQQCSVRLLYLNWAIYLGGLLYLLAIGNFLVAAIWLVLLPLGLLAYVRLFPMISVYLGYGDVEDKRTRGAIYPRVNTKVRFYTAVGCPFCPLVARRLARLRAQMGFELEQIDITYYPELLSKKGIRAVPVVEVGDRRLVGHATTDQLVALIAGSEAEAAA
jgi:glutaredoxin